MCTLSCVHPAVLRFTGSTLNCIRTAGTKCSHLSGFNRALAWTGDPTVPAGFESHCGKLRFETLAIPLTPLCQCLSEETLKSVGPFYLVSMPGEVKDPTSLHWKCVTLVDSTTHSKLPHWRKCPVSLPIITQDKTKWKPRLREK